MKNKIHLKIVKNKIVDASCSCNESITCSHITAGLLFIRPQVDQLEKPKRAYISDKNFVADISAEELEHFTIARMKSDKDFKILLKARFIIKVQGIEHFESYLAKAFPPTKTTKILPTHKEVRLFKQVVEELQDQIKDLVGLDNYVDASTILVPLIKKSFYFKNRFVDVPELFLQNHLFLVEMSNTIHDIIEAPSLKSENGRKIISLLTLSYVELTHIKEKNLILDLIHPKVNKTLIIKILKSKNADHHVKSYKQFLNALNFICTSRPNQADFDMGSVFIEIYSWYQSGHDYVDELLNIAQSFKLPLRFVEKLLTIIPENDQQKKLQTNVALRSIKDHRSFSVFEWIYTHHAEQWQVDRMNIIEALQKKKDYDTLTKILIHEKEHIALFSYLKDSDDIVIYHRYLKELLEISRKDTLELYTLWAENYLNNHFGQAASDIMEKHLRKIGAIDGKLKNEVEKFVMKIFGERPSINT